MGLPERTRTSGNVVAQTAACGDPYFAQKNFYNRQWRAACKEAGFWDAEAKRVTVRFHDLRVTFASLRAREGMPPHKLRALMGHSGVMQPRVTGVV